MRPSFRPKHEARLRCYRKGWNDTEIASATGENPITIRAWRKRYGLKPNSPRELSAQEERERRAVYAQGLSDAEAATLLGLGTRAAMTMWRRRHKLPANKPRAVSKEESRARLILYFEGLSDDEIGKRRGVSRIAIKAWRETRNLPLIPKRARTPDLRTIVMLYAEGTTDKGIAEIIGRRPEVVAAWREAHSLPPNSRSPAHGPRHRPDNYIAPIENERRMQTYLRTSSDADAARALGLHVVTFADWRRGRGLPPNGLRTVREWQRDDAP